MTVIQNPYMILLQTVHEIYNIQNQSINLTFFKEFIKKQKNIFVKFLFNLESDDEEKK